MFTHDFAPLTAQRTEAALPQIASLNPLVSLSALPMGPFATGDQDGMLDFLTKEKVDIVVACDLARGQLVSCPSFPRSHLGRH